jgi:hypothetical protein
VDAHDIDVPVGPTLDARDVKTVAAIADPALRNVWITHCYAELNRRVRTAARLDTDHCWCGFATWASTTAGRTIRREDLPRVIVDLLEDSERHRDKLDTANSRLAAARWAGAPSVETPDILAALADALDDARDHVAHGNLVVFEELAPLFVAFAELIERDGPDVDTDAIRSALEAAAGGPIADDLGAAFEWYGRALAASSPDERARAVLAANVIAVSHEQRRLQDDVAAALIAGLKRIGEAADAVLDDLHRRSRWPFIVTLSRPFSARALRKVIEHAWDVAVTAMMMTLRVPGAELHLGKDVPPNADGRRFPVGLSELAGPPVADPDAAAVFAKWDRTHGTGRHDAARDWGDLDERMSYIANLFRSRQQDPSLANAPFSDEQVAEMRAGRMPSPPLLPPKHGADHNPLA